MSLSPDPLLERARELYDARRYAEVAELLAPVEHARLLELPELGFMLAASERRGGRPEPALRLALELEEPCRRRGSARLQHRRLNLEAILSFETGRVADAERLWTELLSAATEDDDVEFLANACNNLGVVYTLQARTDQALATYERALGSYIKAGDRDGIAHANQNLGIVYRELHHYIRSDERFVHAREHAWAVRNERLLGRIEAERGLLLLRFGDHALASATCARARSRLERAGDPAGVAEADRASGLVALGSGDPVRARERLQQAIDGALEAGNALLVAESRLGLAFALTSEQPARADELRAQARDTFDALGAGGWAAQLEAWLGPLASSSPEDRVRTK